MNKEVANSYFPLYRVEVYERPKGEVEFLEDDSQMATILEIYKKEHVDDEWIKVLAGEFDDMMVALSYAGVSFHRIKRDLPLEPLSFTITTPESRKLWFPLRKIVIEEYVYGRDTGSSWSDPENDIRHSVSGQFFIQKALNGNWEKDYSAGYGSVEYGVHAAMVTQTKLIWDVPYQFASYNQDREEKIVMFEAYANLFKFKYHFPEQKAICGDSLTGYYNEYEGDSSIKVDYMHSHVFLHEEGNVITFRCCLWLNCENIGSFKDLNDKYGITPSDIEWGNKNFKDWLKANHPEAKNVKTLFSWYSI